MKSITIFGKQLPLAVLAAVLIIGGAGAAAGVTMQGDVQGDATTKVDQAIVAEEVTETTGNANNALGTVSDDGTQFKFSANINQGDKYSAQIALRNNGEQALNGRLELKVPEPLEVEVDGSSGISAARSSMYTWMLNVESGEVTEGGGAKASTFTTTNAVADSNNDGQITAADFTYNDGSGDSDTISSVSVNSDGTVTITASNGNFDSGDTITYERQQYVTLTVATPDDVEPGFYDIEGEITPEEV